MFSPDFSKYFCGEAHAHLLSVLERALAEDGPDLTSDGVFAPESRMQAIILAKEHTIISGLPVIPMVLALCEVKTSPDAEPEPYHWSISAPEGTSVAAGTCVAELAGPARQLLRAERIILNLVCRLSGIANLTRRYVQALEGTGVRLLDTRKTAPGLRYPDKYGVLCGGGWNHRRNLSELLMLKDNHIDAAGSITRAVDMLRKKYTPCPPIEVECRTEAEVKEAVACGVERIMLDNMDVSGLSSALPLIPSTIEAEVSGGVCLETIRELATASSRRPPDFISVGRITHSAPTADFSMRLNPAASH